MNRIKDPELYGIGYQYIIEENSQAKMSISNFSTLRLINDEYDLDGFVITCEDEKSIRLSSVVGKVYKRQEFGIYYPYLEAYEGEALISYDKETKLATGNLFDTTQVRNRMQMVYFIRKVLEFENKFLYVTSLSKGIINSYSISNFLSIILNQSLSQLEGCIKNIGIDFVMENIGSADFELKNEKKLSSAISLPSGILDFLKHHPSCYEYLKDICKDDPNEGLYLLKWYDFWSNKKLFSKEENNSFESFLSFIKDIKGINSNIKTFDLVPYLVTRHL
jgi:hypothetical protein